MKRLPFFASAMGLMLLLSVLASCSPAAAPTKPPPKSAEGDKTQPIAKRKLTLATATTGGVFWPMGQEMANIWNAKVANVEVTAISTNGTAENIQKLGFKDVDLGFAVSGVVFDAVAGTGEYKAYGKQTTLQGVAALHPNVVHLVVRKDAGIKSIKDLKDKPWGPGANGSATAVNTREIMESLGLKGDADLKGFYVGYDETVANMKNKKIVGATLAAGIGGKAVIDALAVDGWELLSLSDAELDAVIKKYPAYFRITIAANTYAGQTQPVQTLAQSSILITREDVPADVIYNLTKTFYENLSTLGQKVSVAKDIQRENALKGIDGVVPLHKGAAQYYKEIGLLK